jgi:xylan 1,4-beta-xylosidase
VSNNLIFPYAAASGELQMPWRNAIAVGRAADLLRADLLEHLLWLQHEVGYRYCRFHAVFHDDMAVAVRRPDGQIAYQWHLVDKIYDSLLALGLKPFVELNSMPAALASGTQAMFYYQMNVTPPKDYAEWGALVGAFAGHLVERYGLAEVRQWYFEVWNEPNLAGFWSGTKEDYWQLYGYAARALKKIDPQLRVGGPASSKANWIADIIEHCTANGVPLDFVSTHLYSQDEYVEFNDRQSSPHRLGEFFGDHFRNVQKLVAASARPDLEIHWTEWNSLSATSSAAVDWSTNVYVDNLYAASFIVRNCIELDATCQTMCYWVASDIFEEGGIANSPFSGTYGLLTIHGIPKASANAFRFLRRMTGKHIPLKASAPPAGCGLYAVREGHILRVLAWNNQPLEIKTPATWREQLQLPVENAASHLLVASRIRAGAGSAYETWCELGKPHNLSPAEEALLRQHSEPEQTAQVVSVQDGHLILPITLPPHEVVLLELRPRDQTLMPRNARSADITEWDKAMSEKSR